MGCELLFRSFETLFWITMCLNAAKFCVREAEMYLNSG